MNPSIHTAQVLPPRAVLFLGVVALHGVFIYLFASGLIAQTVRILLPPPAIDFIDIKKQPPPTPPPPPYQPTTVIAKVVDPLPPVLDINVPTENAITPPPEQVATPNPIPVPPAPLPIRLVGRNVMPNTADYYPPSQIRDGNQGITEIRSCVDPNGRLDGTPTVETSSGYEPLDKAAVRLAKDGKYARAFRGDVPVPNCYRFRVNFTLH